MKSNNWLVDFNFLSVKDRGTKTCNKNLSFKDPESPDLPVLQNLHFVLSHRLQGNNHTASGLRQGFSEACLSKGLSHSPAVWSVRVQRTLAVWSVRVQMAVLLSCCLKRVCPKDSLSLLLSEVCVSKGLLLSEACVSKGQSYSLAVWSVRVQRTVLLSLRLGMSERLRDWLADRALSVTDARRLLGWPTIFWLLAYP